MANKDEYNSETMCGVSRKRLR